MKTLFNPSQPRRIFGILIPLIVFILSLANAARAGMNCEMDVIRFSQYGYYFGPNVTTNGTQDLPYGTYYFTSFGWPTNGTAVLFQFDATGFNEISATPYGFGDYPSMAYQLTNGLWTVYATNSVTTNIYHFAVKLNTSGNDFPLVDITYPADGATGIPENATFTWQGGPTDYSDLIVYQGPNSTFLPITQTSWQPPTMTDGSQNFTAHYDSNSTTCVVSSQPVDSGSHPISSWSSTGHLMDWNTSTFTVSSNGIPPADFNSALGTTDLVWTTSGDTDWFIENTNTDGISSYAAQSGQVEDSQTSTLSTTVTGPGTLTFYWSSQDPNGGAFDYEFSIDGDDNDDIYNDTAWYQELDPNSGYTQPFSIPAGQHTLTWTTSAYGDEDPTEAGFLADVSYVPTLFPSITLNPFNQTNYPGYRVWLDAGATPTNATWQWYKVGSGEVLGATSSYYIPTNSGTAGVAGSYYAIATDASGSAITTTALVSFVSAPLPPSWTTAFKSPFEPQDDTQITKDYYYGCCVDPSGNLYAAAEFGGNVTVGSLNLESGSGGVAAGIVKETPTGSPLWAAGITNVGAGYAYSINVAPGLAGGVYLLGNYINTNLLGTNVLADDGNGSIFLASFNAGGTNLWVKTFGGANGNYVELNQFASDAAGNVTFAGQFGDGPLTIGASNYVVNVNGSQGLLAQLDSTGAVRWSQLFPTPSPEAVRCIVASEGRLYVSLNTTVNNGTTNAVIGGVTNITDRSWAIACLNGTNGHAIWVRGLGPQYNSANGDPYAVGFQDDAPILAVSSTNVFVTGVAYSSSAMFGALTVNFGDLRGQYVARYDTNGNAIVANTFGSVTTTPTAASVNAQGYLYVGGTFDNYSFFGQDMIAAPGETDPANGAFSQSFLAKFDPNGNALWANEAVSSTTAYTLGVAATSNGAWLSGWCVSGYYPQTVPTVYGTNNVYSDELIIYGGAGGSEAIIWYPAGVLANVTDAVTVPTPVTLLNANSAGSNFQFQFLSESGFNHDVLYRTNLIVGNWQTNSTILGDGTLKTVSIPFSLFSPAQQGFVRVTTR
jgi:hypothetical protein